MSLATGYRAGGLHAYIVMYHIIHDYIITSYSFPVQKDLQLIIAVTATYNHWQTFGRNLRFQFLSDLN